MLSAPGASDFSTACARRARESGEEGRGAAPARTAPGPRGRRLLGSLLEVRRDRIAFVRSATHQFGDVVRFRMGGRHLFLLSNPAHAQHVLKLHHRNYVKGLGLAHAKPLFGNGLLTSEGALWAAQRHRLQEAFGPSRLAGFATHTVAATDAMLARWQAAEAGGAVVDVGREMLGLTLDVLGRTFLRGDLARDSDSLLADLEVVFRWAMRRMASLVELPLAVPTPANLRMKRALARVQARVDRLIEDHALPRSEESEKEPDAIDVLLQAVGASGLQQVRDEAATLLVAGHETSGTALAWLWHCLAASPAALERLAAEVDEVCRGAPPTVEDAQRLVFTGWAVDETLRLYPPVWMVPRRALEEDEIGGFRIPAGADVLVSIYSVHRHPEHWPEPDAFRPERFDLPSGSTRPPTAYLPFGCGPRACLGRVFGRLEVILAAARIAQRYRLEALPGAPVRAEALLTLLPHGLAMRLRPRVSAA